MHIPQLVGFAGVGLLCAFVACTGATDEPTTSDNDLTALQKKTHAPDGSVADAGATNDVRVIVEPSDHGAALVNAITAATTSVHMTMYELSSPTVISALVARHHAGVEVKVILNAKFLSSGPNPNQSAFSTLQSAGVPVVWSSPSFELTHEKTVVIDRATAWIMTMNASRTSPDDNREYLAVESDAAAIVEAEAQFAADFAGTAYAPSGPLLMSPVTMRPGLTSLIASATRTLDFEVEELSDPALTKEFCAAVGRHVTVHGVLSNSTPSSVGRTALSQLKACGVTMLSLAVPYLHAKAIVVDSARAYVGSANFSTTSLDQNRELGLVTTNAATVSSVESTIASDISSATILP
jgi:phosphatidylserine/phosphatidylglycerophosphate/cardiolipin synthase-like enzyme